MEWWSSMNHISHRGWFNHHPEHVDPDPTCADEFTDFFGSQTIRSKPLGFMSTCHVTIVSSLRAPPPAANQWAMTRAQRARKPRKNTMPVTVGRHGCSDALPLLSAGVGGFVWHPFVLSVWIEIKSAWIYCFVSWRNLDSWRLVLQAQFWSILDLDKGWYRQTLGGCTFGWFATRNESFWTLFPEFSLMVYHDVPIFSIIFVYVPICSHVFP